MAVDAESHYLVNGFPYLGKNEHRSQNQSLSEYIVLKLVELYLNKRRNVTCEIFFIALKLEKSLKAKKRA